MQTTNLFAEATWLGAQQNQGYGRAPIPSARDQEISGLLRRWMALRQDERQAAAASITEDQSPTLLAYSERMASYCVRQSSQEWAFLGLVAQGLEGWRGDWRDNVLLLPLHYDALRRIGASPEKVFHEAADVLHPKVAQGMAAFLKREPADRSLGAMGYEVSADDDGFRYRRAW